MTANRQWPRHRGERGAGTVLSVGIVLVLCCALIAGAWIAGWVSSIHRGRQAADLAALAGAQAQVRASDVCGAARRIAGANGAELSSCSLTGDRRDFVVRVEIRIRLTPQVAGRPQWTTVSATAGSLQRR